MKVFHIAWLLNYIIMLTFTGVANGTVEYYFDESTFLHEVSTLGRANKMESFEDLGLGHYSPIGDIYDFNGFTISYSNTGTCQMRIGSDENYATDGDEFLNFVTASTGAFHEYKFTFATPVLVFGLNIIGFANTQNYNRLDYSDNLGNETIAIPYGVNGPRTTFFFGVISDIPLTEVNLSPQYFYGDHTDFSTSMQMDEIYTVGTNVPPVADAGEDQIISVCDALMLNATNSSDEEDKIVSWEWSLKRIDGNAILNRSATGEIAVVKGLESGFYNVVLTVTDDVGDSDTSEILVAVSTNSFDVNGDCRRGVSEVINILKELTTQDN